MVLIEDVIVPSKGTGKYFTISSLQYTINRSSESAPGFYWEVKKQVSVENSDGTTVLSPGETILNGNLYMTKEEYAQWAADDGYIYDWALPQLGFTEIEIN